MMILMMIMTTGRDSVRSVHFVDRHGVMSFNLVCAITDF